MQEGIGGGGDASTNAEKKGSLKNMLKVIYEDNYKKLLIIPFVVLLVAFGVIGHNIYSTGSFINKGVSLKGGTSITILNEKVTANEVESFLSDVEEINVRTLSGAGKTLGVVIETGVSDDAEISAIKAKLVEKYSLADSEVTVETVGSALGSSFFKETMRALILSFIFMSIVIFIYFRTIIPSFAVILSAFSDIVITIAVLDIAGIRVGTAGIAALLMLIGYSVDTDILLTIRVLKRKEGSLMERVYSSIKTGMMMTLTAMAAILVALIFSQNEVTTQIMIILLIGLAADLMNTWVQNVAILRWYVERKASK